MHSPTPGTSKPCPPTHSNPPQEAAASGVKVGEARRLLKVMQGLEAAVQAAVEGPFQYQALKVRQGIAGTGLRSQHGEHAGRAAGMSGGFLIVICSE